MTLKGNLEVLNLGDIFQTLSLNKHTGTLKVSATDKEKLIYFSEGEIALLSSSKRVRLGERLVNAGLITEQELEKALQKQKGSGMKLGEVLIDEGIVEEADIIAVVRSQIEEEIYELFLWEKADFEFLVDYCPPELRDPGPHLTKLRFNTSGLVLEAARRADEWKLIREEVPSLKEIYRLVRDDPGAFADIDVADSVKREVRWIDGEHSVQAMCEESGCSEFEICKLLYEMKRRELVHVLSPQELAEKAEKFYDGNKFKPAAMMYERLVEHLPTNTNLRWNLASCYKVLGVHDKAIQQYEFIADRAEQRREFEELNRACSHILHLAPNRKDIQAKLQRISRLSTRKKANQKVILIGIGVVLLVGGIGGGLYMGGVLDRNHGNISVAEQHDQRAEELFAQADQLLRSGDRTGAENALITILNDCKQARRWSTVELWISVTTAPPGVDVYINGELKGRTPLTNATYRPVVDGDIAPIQLELRYADSDIVLRSEELAAIPPPAERPWRREYRVLREPAWTVDVHGAVLGPPCLWGNRAYVVSRDAHLYAIDLQQHRALQNPVVLGVRPPNTPNYETMIFGDVFSPPTLVQGVVFAGTSEGTVLAIQAETGAMNWSYSGSEGGRAVGEIRGRPAVDLQRGACVVGDEGGFIHFINITNGRPLRDPIPTLNRIDAGPLVANGVAYVGSRDNRLYAVNLSTLQPAWIVDLGDDITATPVVYQNRLIVAAGTYLYALEAPNGHTIWRIPMEGRAVDALTLQDDVVYVATDASRLYAVEAGSVTGAFRWDGDGSRRLDGRATVRPVVRGPIIYCGDDEGTICGIERDNGVILWRARVYPEGRSAPVTCAPLILDDGAILVGTGRGTVSYVEP